MIHSFAEPFEPIGLDAVRAVADLQDRLDVKYLAPRAVLGRLAERLRDTHRVLEIAGLRAFAYDTTYFDTAELRVYRDHLQGRRRRFKCRSRDYVDSGLCTFEVKLAGARGRTVKHRMAYSRDQRRELSLDAARFLRECVTAAYGHAPEAALRPALLVAYTRVTLAAPELGERLTFDFDLSYRAPDGAAGGLDRGTVIVESKSPRGDALADRALRELGVRPATGCSKYCLGVGLTRPGVTRNPLLPLLRRHFVSGLS